MDTQARDMPIHILPTCLQIQLPPLATRRFVRRYQRRSRRIPQRPLEATFKDPSRYPDITHPFLSGRYEPDFGFLAPDCRLVQFPYPALLPRVLEFEAPPRYDTLSPQFSHTNSEQSSPSGSLFDYPPTYPPRSAINVTVRSFEGALTPAPTQGSRPSYDVVSPGPPTDEGLANYVQAGLEYEDNINGPADAALLNALYRTAPWTSSPGLRRFPCRHEGCPVYPIPHNSGIYFHHGRRPSPKLQADLRFHGYPEIWDGGNPPREIWESYIAEIHGEWTDVSRATVSYYRHLHCMESGQPVEDRLFAHGDRAKAEQRVRAWRATRQQLENRATVVPIARPFEHNPTRTNLPELSGTTSLRVRNRAINTTSTPVEEHTTPEGDGPRQREANAMGRDSRNGTVDDEVAGFDILDIHDGNDEEDEEPGDGIHDAHSNPRDNDSGLAHGASHADATFRLTELTYWPIFPERHHIYRGYGILPPPIHPFDPRDSDWGRQCRRIRYEDAGVEPISESVMMDTFLEEVGLTGIWGRSHPCPSHHHHRMFNALIRLVQHASTSEAADTHKVNLFLLHYVYGRRPLVAADPALVPTKDEWLKRKLIFDLSASDQETTASDIQEHRT